MTFDWSEFPEEAIEKIVERQRKRFAMKPKVAIAGFGKSGKSSLFNAIYGEKVAKVSMRTDETQKENTLERFGIDFTDTPGIGTAMFSLDKVVQTGVLDRQHVIIHTLNGTSAISAEDENLHGMIDKSTAARITVVNKVEVGRVQNVEPVLTLQHEAGEMQITRTHLEMRGSVTYFADARKGGTFKFARLPNHAVSYVLRKRTGYEKTDFGSWPTELVLI